MVEHIAVFRMCYHTLYFKARTKSNCYASVVAYRLCRRLIWWQYSHRKHVFTLFHDTAVLHCISVVSL